MLGLTRQAIATTSGSGVTLRTSVFGHRATTAGALAAAIDGAAAHGDGWQS